MSDAPLGVAIVGCGWAGTRHARAYAELDLAAGRSGAPRPEVRYAVDTDFARAGVLAGTAARCRPTTALSEALRDPAVHAVDICLPHALHADATIEALRAGKHVLCEKPLAATLEEADRMLAEADRAGLLLMVAENVRYDPVLRRVAELLQGGAIGRPALVQVRREAYLVRSFLDDRRWFLDRRAAGGGIMMSGGVHDVEVVRMLAGEVVGVQAVRARQRFAEMEGDDTSVALLRLADGAVAVLIESFVSRSLETASGTEVHTVRIDGDHGSMTVQADRTIRLFSERPRSDAPMGGDAHDLVEQRIAVPPDDTFRLMIEHFLGCIRSGQPALTSGRSQRRPLEVVLAAYRSMETGAAVDV